MKKIIFVFAFLCASQLTSAQEVGIRFGNLDRGNVAVDGIFSVGEFSRIHADVSFADGGVGIAALYDFIYRPIDGESLKWYAGLGPSLILDNDFFFGVSGEIGLEYHFDGAPIAIGGDWRPTFWILEETDFRSGGFGLNVRYVF